MSRAVKPFPLRPEIWDVATREPVYTPTSIEAGIHTHEFKMREMGKYFRLMKTVEAFQELIRAGKQVR
jgi:hypothetical protein